MMEKKPRRDTGECRLGGDEQGGIGELSALQRKLRETEGALYKAKAGEGLNPALKKVLAELAILKATANHVMKVQDKLADKLAKLSEKQCRSIMNNGLTEEGVKLMAAAKAQHDGTAERPIPSEDQALIEFLWQSCLLKADPNDPEGPPTYLIGDLIGCVDLVVREAWDEMGNPLVYGDEYEPPQQWLFTFEASLVTAYQEAIGEALANPIEVVKGILKKIFSSNVTQYVEVTMTEVGDEVKITIDPWGADDNSPLNQLGRHLEATNSKAEAKAHRKMVNKHEKNLEKAEKQANKVKGCIGELLDVLDNLRLDDDLSASDDWSDRPTGR